MDEDRFILALQEMQTYGDARERLERGWLGGRIFVDRCPHEIEKRVDEQRAQILDDEDGLPRNLWAFDVLSSPSLSIIAGRACWHCLGDRCLCWTGASRFFCLLPSQLEQRDADICGNVPLRSTVSETALVAMAESPEISLPSALSEVRMKECRRCWTEKCKRVQWQNYIGESQSRRQNIMILARMIVTTTSQTMSARLFTARVSVSYTRATRFRSLHSFQGQLLTHDSGGPKQNELVNLYLGEKGETFALVPPFVGETLGLPRLRRKDGTYPLTFYHKGCYFAHGEEHLPFIPFQKLTTHEHPRRFRDWLSRTTFQNKALARPVLQHFFALEQRIRLL
nr:hypothetical protein CFP56_69336 [Quercus suber]